MDEQRFCKKCLLHDIKEDIYFKNMYEYIDNLDEEIKTNDKEYERRLSLCKECEKLMKGMCRSCGCFVEMRAAVYSNHCPDIKKYW